jgi:aspartate aminotransferase-like enzyme
MFGPNSNVPCSHRDKKFIDLKKSVEFLFIEKFPYLKNYDILFIPGSGTLGMEAVIKCLLAEIEVVGPDEKFTNRWRDIYKTYKSQKSKTLDKISLSCKLETSKSLLSNYATDVVDAISSFPYYPIEINTKIFVTCSNKQLGAPAGLAIIGVRKDSWDLLQSFDNSYSYMDLYRYKNNIPVTYPIEIFKALKANLENNKFLEQLYDKINSSWRIVKEIGPEYFINETMSPVLTFKKPPYLRNLQKNMSSTE